MLRLWVYPGPKETTLYPGFIRQAGMRSLKGSCFKDFSLCINKRISVPGLSLTERSMTDLRVLPACRFCVLWSDLLTKVLRRLRTSHNEWLLFLRQVFRSSLMGCFAASVVNTIFKILAWRFRRISLGILCNASCKYCLQKATAFPLKRKSFP
jgi:sulfatase maturation enzyme AslB (radical SAM superfamily)